MPPTILRIAVATPLNRSFDYLPPEHCDPAKLVPGIRVEVPFGRGRRTGVLLEICDQPAVEISTLKRIHHIIDQQPLPTELMTLGRWAARYYHHPPGEVFAAMLPGLLRSAATDRIRGPRRWRLTDAGRAALQDPSVRLGHRQRALLTALREQPDGLGGSELDAVAGNWRAAARVLTARGWLAIEQQPRDEEAVVATEQPPELNPAQRHAVDSVLAALDGFHTFLLEGVTGSGKTEVYLHIAATVLAQGRQVLILVPEIGLAPQLVARFKRRFNKPIAVLHSALGARDRLDAWRQAGAGRAAIILGTRSAVFTPMADPGLIIVDEEHDASLTQQDGFRYSARDLALVRARNLGIPVVLGSATPSLESLHNVETGRYRDLQLPQRAAKARPPTLELLDIRSQPMHAGMSGALVERARSHLEKGEQVLVFLNRRGYAPTLLCHHCGWTANCQRCDAHFTLHRRLQRLICHHCGAAQSLPECCPSCQNVDLHSVGEGTERIEQNLTRLFPGYPVTRVDRDTTRRKGELDNALERIRRGDAQLLVGTQMLAKGHHFPALTLVAVVDADQGLLSADFRASERMAQLIVQVAGRAGRGKQPGHVLIQTHQPTHPLLQTLVRSGYHGFAASALAERRDAGLPPFAWQALLRAEATDQDLPQQFLEEARQQHPGDPGVELWGPVPAPMERRAGRWRAQLMVHSLSRPALHRFLDRWAPALESLRSARKVRWSLDVDPIDTY